MVQTMTNDDHGVVPLARSAFAVVAAGVGRPQELRARRLDQQAAVPSCGMTPFARRPLSVDFVDLFDKGNAIGVDRSRLSIGGDSARGNIAAAARPWRNEPSNGAG